MKELIDKSAIVAEIEKLYNEDYKFLPSDIAESVVDFKDDLLMVLDSLSTVKEVDLKKEVDLLIQSSTWAMANREDFLRVAKHFFELGIKSKGE